MPNDKQAQVAAQCNAINHMATAIALVHADYAQIIAGGQMESTLDMVGQRTASFMEQLGEMLNAMDACDESDDWMIPVFREAQRLWPVTDPSAHSKGAM
jgi:hypothetical protein